MELVSRAAVLDGVGGEFSVAEAPVPDPVAASLLEPLSVGIHAASRAPPHE